MNVVHGVSKLVSKEVNIIAMGRANKDGGSDVAVRTLIWKT
jgi:hypothetical protein